MLAVEPSPVMIAQRPPGAAPAVCASAEAIPLPDCFADAAMAVLTIHHWDDLERGLAELRRIARRRVVVVTWDPDIGAHFWLIRDYLPEVGSWDAARVPTIARLVDLLGGADVESLPIPCDCTDGFLGAYWRRPAAYLDPAVRAGISLFSRPDAPPADAGLARLAADLESGAWTERNHDLVDLEELDIGYRILVVTP